MLRLEDDGPVRTITLDRPDRRNALTSSMLEVLDAAVTETDASIVYIHGAGPAFCAGADLDEVAALDPESAAAFAGLGQRTLDAVQSSSPVVVAGIDGPAFGGGVELALTADLRIATPDATFAEPGVRLGIFGTWGGTVRLPRIVGLGDAMDLALTGRTIDARSALRMGLVSRIVDDPRVVIDELVAVPADALRVVRDRLRDDRPTAEQQSAEVAAFSELIRVHGADIAASRE